MGLSITLSYMLSSCFVIITWCYHFWITNGYAGLMKTTRILFSLLIIYVNKEHPYIVNIIDVFVLYVQSCSFACWKWEVPSFCKENSTNHLYRICYFHGCWQHFKIKQHLHWKAKVRTWIWYFFFCLYVLAKKVH